MLFKLTLLLSVCTIIVITLLQRRSEPTPLYRQQKAPPTPNTKHKQRSNLPSKPAWVTQEVIRLSALMPHCGCRKIATTFNRLHEHRQGRYQQGMTVSKSYVSYTIKQHRYDILKRRQTIKHTASPVFPSHQTWSMDLTHIVDQQHKPHLLLGIIDSGSRYCVHLKQVQNKNSITLLRALLDTIEQHGKPKHIKTDNEKCFTSALFQFGLRVLNIKHQRSKKHCPWQNGKIERLFGTLKNRLRYHALSSQQFKQEIHQFTVWYNYLRPHQHLNGKTPAEQHHHQPPNQKGKHHLIRLWNGVLTGFYIPPD